MFGDNFLQGFIEETRELLEKLESDLLELESDPGNLDNISAVFRTFHTIKGSASMFGFDEIARFTHHVENILDLAREDKLKIDHEVISLILKSKDHIQNLLEQGDTEDLKVKTEEIIALAKKILGEEDQEKSKDSSKEVETKDEKEDSKEDEKGSWYYVYFKPASDFYFSGSKPERIIDEIREISSKLHISVTTEIPLINDFDPENCYYIWSMLCYSEAPKDELEDVFIFVQNIAEIKVETIFDMQKQNDLSFFTFIDSLKEDGILIEEILGTNSSPKPKDEVKIVKEIEKAESPKEEKKEEKTPKKEIKKQDVKPAPKKAALSAHANTSIRVASDKLDNLVDMIGQLVTIDASIKQRVLSLKDPELEQITELLDRVVDDMRDLTMNIRMMPIGNTFEKFRRLVRDLSMELGKKIELSTEGSDTELDKNVIEKINEPLVHLIRNSIDHGIELPDERVKSGKKETGNINLTASYSGASVIITIEDDGNGIDKEVIGNKAVDKGIVTQDALNNMSDGEIYELIFAAGFSTAEQVTSVSGRGVGMDVVRREIESLRGKVNIESSLGQGSKMILTLPLTLAIIEGLLVKIGTDSYTIALSAVESCMDYDRNLEEKKNGRSIIYHREETIPIIKLREMLQYEEESDAREQVVIIQNRYGKSGLVVDKVIGEYQTVIKNLGEFYKNVEGVMGASILGDGTVSLILDLDMISGIAIRQENSYIQKIDKKTFIN